MPDGELRYCIVEYRMWACGATERETACIRRRPRPCPQNSCAEAKEHKPETLRILRGDEEPRGTGQIRSERRVFDLTSDSLGKGEDGL
jgi:hypothetical protein